MATKLIETLSAPIKACLVKSVVVSRDNITERLKTAVEKSLINFMKYPDPVLEHIDENHSKLTYVWDEVMMTCIITWARAERNAFKVDDMTFEMG